MNHMGLPDNPAGSARDTPRDRAALQAPEAAGVEARRALFARRRGVASHHPMRTRTSACLFLSAASLAFAGAAAAQPRAPSAFDWVRLPGAEGCIDAPALVQAAELRIGSAAPTASSGAARTLQGSVAPAHGQATFRATFTLTGADGTLLGTREIWTDSEDCRAMDDDLTLVLALLIDPRASIAQEPPATPASPATSSSASPAASPTPASEPASQAEAEPVPTPGPPPRWAASVRAGGVFSLGFFPAVGSGISVRAALTPPGFVAIEVGGVAWTEQRASRPEGTFGADMWIAYGTLAICPLATDRGGFLWAACAGLEIGAVHAGGYGPAITYTQDVPIASLALGARVRHAIAGRFFGAAGLDLSVPFVRPDLYYRAAGQDREIFTGAPIAGTLEIGAGFEVR